MTNYDLEETELLKIQMGLSIIFIFSIIISLSLSYNEILKYQKKPPLYTSEAERTILIINRILAFLIAVGFLYLNWADKQIKNKYNQSNKYSDLQIGASMITLVATVIVLYIALDSSDYSTSLENPNI